jgi:hypothetical protein
MTSRYNRLIFSLLMCLCVEVMHVHIRTCRLAVSATHQEGNQINHNIVVTALTRLTLLLVPAIFVQTPPLP